MVLSDIEEFYHTTWQDRANKVLSKQQIIQIQNITSMLIDDLRFKLYYSDPNSNGYSNNSHTIFINGNNETNIPILIMHELGHIQYQQKEFEPVIEYNRQIIYNPLPIVYLNDLDFKYFTDEDEIRQRLIPLIREINNSNFILDNYEEELFNIYDREQLKYWLDNIL